MSSLEDKVKELEKHKNKASTKLQRDLQPTKSSRDRYERDIAGLKNEIRELETTQREISDHDREERQKHERRLEAKVANLERESEEAKKKSDPSPVNESGNY